jgi:hypothetical protein
MRAVVWLKVKMLSTCAIRLSSWHSYFVCMRISELRGSDCGIHVNAENIILCASVFIYIFLYRSLNHSRLEVWLVVLYFALHCIIVESRIIQWMTSVYIVVKLVMFGEIIVSLFGIRKYQDRGFIFYQRLVLVLVLLCFVLFVSLLWKVFNYSAWLSR